MFCDEIMVFSFPCPRSWIKVGTGVKLFFSSWCPKARFLTDEEIAAVLDESDADLSDAEDPEFCVSAQDESGSGVHSDTTDQEVSMDVEDEHETPSPPKKRGCSWKEAP